jgi:hypothetical protein
VVYDRKPHIFTIKDAARILGKVDFTQSKPGYNITYGISIISNIPRLIEAILQYERVEDWDLRMILDALVQLLYVVRRIVENRLTSLYDYVASQVRAIFSVIES